MDENIEQLNKPRMNILTLRFSDDAVEQTFLDDYYAITLKRIRFGLIVGASLYALFGVLDGLIIPEAKNTAWLIRYGIICPYFIAFYLFTYSSVFKRIIQVAIALTIFIAGMGIIVMLAVAGVPGKYIYYSGLILVIMFAYTFVNLRIVYSTAVSWLLVVIHGMVSYGDAQVNFPIFLNNNFFFVAANIIGMFAGYMMELSARRNFIQMRVIESNLNQLEREVGERKRIEEQLRMMSLTDELTGLYNRRGFFTLSDQQLRIARRQGRRILMLYVDLDDLKVINDSRGHQEGDRALMRMAEILRRNCRDSDIVARIGGDEFVVFFGEPVLTSPEDMISRLQKEVDSFNETRQTLFRLSVSIGVAYYDPGMHQSLDEPLAQADRMMYEQKKSKQKS